MDFGWYDLYEHPESLNAHIINYYKLKLDLIKNESFRLHYSKADLDICQNSHINRFYNEIYRIRRDREIDRLAESQRRERFALWRRIVVFFHLVDLEQRKEKKEKTVVPPPEPEFDYNLIKSLFRDGDNRVLDNWTDTEQRAIIQGSLKLHIVHDDRFYEKEYFEKHPDLSTIGFSIQKSREKFRKFNKTARYYMLTEKLNKQYDLENFWNALSEWSRLVKKNFEHKCWCGERATQSHHIFHRAKYPKLALNLNNGIALCDHHHFEVHGKKIKVYN